MGGSASKPVQAAATAAAGEAAKDAAKPSGCCGIRPSKIHGVAKYEQRKCNDLLCFLLFIVFWIGMIIVGAVGFVYGQPMRLVYGNDYQGNVCGVDKADSKYVVYPRVNEDFLLNLAKKSPLDYRFYGICVSTCPGPLEVVCNYLPAELHADPYNNTVKLSCIANPSYTPPSGVSCTTVKDNCWITPVQTQSTLFRCLPTYGVNNTAGSVCVYPEGVTSAYDPACIVAQDNKSGETTRPAKTNQLYDAVNTARALWGRWFGDLFRAWWVILVSAVGFGLVFGFFWLLLAKWFTPIFVWGTVFLILAGLGTLTGYFYYKGGVVQFPIPDSLQAQLNKFDAAASSAANTVSYYVPQSLVQIDDMQLAYRIIAYVSTAVTLLAVVLVIALRRAIATAVKVIRLGATALQAMPSLVFFPLTTVVAIAAFLLWWIFAAAALATSGSKVAVNAAQDVLAGLKVMASDNAYANATVSAFLTSPTLNSTFTTIEDKPTNNYLLIYHFFGLLWTTQFVQGFAIMTIAGAVCAWYFSRDPTGGKTGAAPPPTLHTLERWPLYSSFNRTLRFAMGTIAFGSLLIAILQFIRAVLAYVAKKMHDSGADKNTALRFAMCCIQCCLACVQKCLELVTRNAYIYSALKGTSFIESGKTVVGMIIANVATLGAINVLSEVILFLGKVLVSLGAGWVAYALLDNVKMFRADGSSPITSTWLIITVVLFFAYAVASSFMIVFDIAIDAVLICYIVDTAENGGSAKHMDASVIHSVADEKRRAEAGLKAEAAAAKGGVATAAGAAIVQGPGLQLASVTPVHIAGPASGSGAAAAIPAGSAAMYDNPQRPAHY